MFKQTLHIKKHSSVIASAVLDSSRVINLRVVSLAIFISSICFTNPAPNRQILMSLFLFLQFNTNLFIEFCRYLYPKLLAFSLFSFHSCFMLISFIYYEVDNYNCVNLFNTLTEKSFRLDFLVFFEFKLVYFLPYHVNIYCRNLEKNITVMKTV